ncbi:hypothetical protein Tco_0625274 [Tanacetum coccineum]|uniref:Uncharacterized protein n=1 Tax=Tanacetum coccineum TaxID=301880 RepID=A0ABQ4WGE5_9ASTR
MSPTKSLFDVGSRDFLFISAITELEYFIKPHDHLNPISVSKCNCPWRVNDCVVMLELKSSGLSSRFDSGRLESFLASGVAMIRQLVACSRPHRIFMPPSSSKLTGPGLPGLWENVSSEILFVYNPIHKCRLPGVEQVESSPIVGNYVTSEQRPVYVFA